MFEDEELASDTDDEDFVPEVNETVLVAMVKINSSRQNAPYNNLWSRISLL